MKRARVLLRFALFAFVLLLSIGLFVWSLFSNVPAPLENGLGRRRPDDHPVLRGFR